MLQATTLTTAETLSDELIQTYRRDGFVHVPGIISKAEAQQFREAALGCSAKMKSYSDGGIFTQLVNVWREDDVMRRLTLHPNVGAAAERLAGVKLRLWHDQILIKQPH